MFRVGSGGLVAFQIVTAAGALGAIAVWPPQSGAMLMLSPTGNEAGAINSALSAGGRLLAQGPFPRSVIVTGDYRRLRHALAGRGTILLAAPAVLCGRLPQAEKTG